MLARVVLQNVQDKNIIEDVFNGRCGFRCTKVMRPFKPVGVEFITNYDYGLIPYNTIVSGTRKGLNRYYKSGGKIRAEKRLTKYLIASKQAIPFLRDVKTYFIR